MTEKDFTDLTGLGKRALQIIEGTYLSDTDYQYYRTLFYTDIDKFLAYTEGRPELILKLYTDFAIEAEAEYINRRIPIGIYIDTFSDFRIWFQEAQNTGILNSRWLERHIRLKLFKLGRLQFEIDDVNKSLHIHIPAEGALPIGECMDSLQKADSFFSRKYTYFDCNSWLLSPALPNLLDENSNIIRFRKLFTIVRTDNENRQAEARVFGKLLDNPEGYPENTTLQKNLKAYLIKNLKAGTGYGIIEREKVSSGQL